METKQIKQLCEKVFLDYFNNYLTIDKLMEDYQTDRETIEKILMIGRYENNNKEKHLENN